MNKNKGIIKLNLFDLECALEYLGNVSNSHYKDNKKCKVTSNGTEIIIEITEKDVTRIHSEILKKELGWYINKNGFWTHKLGD